MKKDVNTTPPVFEDFIDPETVRLQLARNRFIDVKRRLNTGEQQELFAKMMPSITPGEAYKLESRHVMTAKVLAYLVGWSLTKNGKAVSVSPDALNNLDPDTFKEIRDAIDTHEEAVTTEIEIAKKNLTGASEWKPPSPSAAP